LEHSAVLAQPYKRPPITEAVIHITFGTAASAADLDKVNRNLIDFYPQYQPTRNVNLEFAVPPDVAAAPSARLKNNVSGHRRSSDDESKIIVLWPTSIIFSQLAPYPGWQEFFGRFVRDWTLWKKILGYRTIVRVGVRYINRIDIPITGPEITYEKYLNVYPHLPNDMSKVFAYGVQVQLPFPEIEGKIVVNSSTVPSPMLNMASFLLDQDLFKDNDCPQNDEGVYKLLEEIHVKKNAVFEACITDRAKELFN
jgi:uncharacterized protein (TIGR04255 family)